MVPNCGQKFEKVLRCMEDRHSKNECRDTIQDFLRCQRDFVRAIVRENNRRGGLSMSENSSENAVQERSPRMQGTQKFTYRVVVETFSNRYPNIQQMLEKAYKKQTKAMAHTWNTLQDPETHRTYTKFCRRLANKIVVTMEKACTKPLTWWSSGRDRS